MKRTLELSAITLLLAFMAGCVSTEGNRNEYFGYSNNPKPREVVIVKERVIEKAAPATASKQQWKNPLAEDEYNASDNEQTANDSPTGIYAENTTTVNTRYVPVMVPWWDRYYYDYMYYEPGFHAGFCTGGWYGYDWCWYNPWYDYHPYYGVRWYPHHYYSNWWYDPYYYHPYPGYNVVYNSPRPRSVRTFGPYRGTYSSADGRSQANTSNQGIVSSSPRSTGYIPEKVPIGSIGSTRSSGLNRTTFTPSSTGRSAYSKPTTDYRQSAAPNKTNYNGRSSGSASGMKQNNRSRYVPQSEAPRSAGRSAESTGNSGNSNRSSYTPPPSSHGNSGSSSGSGHSGSGSSSSGRSSGGSSGGSSSSGRSSRSGK